MSATNYYEREILKHTLLGTQLNVITPYFGLVQSSDPITDATTVPYEPSGNGYQRVDLLDCQSFLGLGAAAVSAFQLFDINSTTETVTNYYGIIFPVATGTWGVIGQWFIADAASGGNILAYGNLSSTRAVNATERLVFPANSISLSVI